MEARRRRAEETQVEEEWVSARLKSASEVQFLHVTCSRELAMKTNQSQSRIGSAILVVSLLLGVGIALSITAQAQNPDDRYAQDRNRNNNGDQNRRDRNWDRYGNYGGSVELRQTALNAGYYEGVRE